MFITLTTNGCFENTDVIQKTIDAGITNVQVSLDAASESTFRKISKKPGLEYVRNSIERFIFSGVEVKIRTVLTDININEVEEILSYTQALGIKEHSVTVDGRITSDFSSANEPNREKMIGYAENVEGLNQPHVDAPYCRTWSDRSQGMACPGLFSSPVIFPNGDVSVCELTPNLVMGNFNKSGLLEIFNSQKASEMRLRVTDRNVINKKCSMCSVLERCGTGCFAYKEASGIATYDPDPRCVT